MIQYIYFIHTCPWSRHDMEKHPALLALCEGKPPVSGECPHKETVIGKFDVPLVVSLTNLLNKQSSCRWFNALWCPCDVTVMLHPCMATAWDFWEAQSDFPNIRKHINELEFDGSFVYMLRRLDMHIMISTFRETFKAFTEAGNNICAASKYSTNVWRINRKLRYLSLIVPIHLTSNQCTDCPGETVSFISKTCTIFYSL